MPKLLWVVLPLLLAAAWALVLALRRRPPSRHAINIGSSLLLVAYVATTAGLGLYWVAKQQLPVFDWHYLFGYATLALLALHLWFNLPIVWRHLRGARAASMAGQTAHTGPARRGLLLVAGAVVVAGAAFALGLRLGRREPGADAGLAGGAASGGDAGGASMAALALVERYHAWSAHSRRGVLLRAPAVSWGGAPPAFKSYPAADRLALPPPATPSRGPCDLAALGAMLWHTAGVTETRGPLALRASPSSGALFSTELYLAVRQGCALAPGLWHYAPQSHALQRLGDARAAAAAIGAAGESTLADVPAAVVATTVLRRTGHKYGDRAYRYILADLGHALENLHRAAGASGLRTEPVAHFDESRAAAALGLDEAEEAVLALLALRPAPAPTGPGQSPASAAPRAFRHERWRAAAVPAADAAPLGATALMHGASSLRAVAADAASASSMTQPPPTATSPGAPSTSSGPLASPPPAADSGFPAAAIALPRASTTTAPVLQLIASRRSVRRFSAAPLALDDLAGVLQGLSNGDGQALSAAVRVNLVVNAVAGLAPGAYRHDAATQRLLSRRAGVDLRDQARAAALDQEVIGGAAVVFVLSVDRATLAADPAGPARGYRHAFIEAGRVGERIYLEAGARRLGVCAVGAFYDDEAAALVAVDPTREWVLHFTAVGIPAV